MRLKGGKLLLDLSQYDLTDEPTISLTQEQIDLVKTKGLTLLLKFSNGISCIFEPIIESIYMNNNMENFIIYRSIKDINEDISLNNEYTITIDFTRKELQVSV